MSAPLKRPANRVEMFPTVTEVGVIPVVSWKAAAGMAAAPPP